MLTSLLSYSIQINVFFSLKQQLKGLTVFVLKISMNVKCCIYVRTTGLALITMVLTYAVVKMDGEDSIAKMVSYMYTIY